MHKFTPNCRLKCKSDYDLVFKNACKVVTSGFLILYINNRINIARLGFAVRKKELPRAYQRNRVRRIIKESFRMQHLPPVDIVCLVKPGIAILNNAQMFNELAFIWRKLNTHAMH